MSYPQTQSPSSNYSHLYPQALQLKLYQAFIFSIPILFSIILFLLFYLFYLKRRFSPPPPTLPRTLRIQPTHQFPPLAIIPDPIAQEDPNFNPDQQTVSPHQGEQVIIVDTNLDNYYCSTEEHAVMLVEGSSSTSTCS
ncbi:hypothetical protein LguiB_034845 [Lonicera macranthoides]